MATSFMLWSQETPLPEAERTPLTLLSGFLGSGKTTLLNHLLRNHGGRKLAVLVNDLGEINIDAALIRSEHAGTTGAAGGMLELTSGCICCSIQMDLLDALLQLWEEHRPDHIIVEATGVAEPPSVLESLFARNFRGHSIMDFLRINALVTVVDAGSAMNHLAPVNERRRKHQLEADRRRALGELLIEQIECADLLVCNQIDRSDEETRHRLVTWLHELNPRARLLESTHGMVDAEAILSGNYFDEGETLAAARWRQEILANAAGRLGEEAGSGTPGESEEAGHHEPGGHGHDHHEKHHHHHRDYGLETWVFNARCPFDEGKFLKLMREGLPGVIRAKGFYWTTRKLDSVGLLSLAGNALRADYLGRWWADQVAAGEETLENLPEIVRNAWLPGYGDRRQELVFIGIDLAKNSIETLLLDCLEREGSWESPEPKNQP